jgi:hypothetical protein
MHYYHRLNYAQRKRFIRSVISLVAMIIVFVMAIFALIYWDNQQKPTSNTPESTTSEITTSTYESSVQIFRTAFFQFQSNSSWSQALAESSEGKFVYRSKRGAIIDHELVVYVNREAEKRPISRVLPVTVKGGAELVPGAVSEHCGNKLRPLDQAMVATVLDKVSFICTPNEPGYNVLVGLSGGTTKINLSRPDSTPATYSIFYSNVTASPDAAQLLGIINTFQSR